MEQIASGLKQQARGPVLELTLDRAAVHNAFNDVLIRALIEALDRASSDASVRVVLLTAEGRSFCAGADLGWMRSLAQAGTLANGEDARQLAQLFRAARNFPKPLLAMVQGAALGGGVGLVSCADIVVAADSVQFGLTEVRLGLAPAVISPFVIEKIGANAARRYFLTGERFSAAEAHRLGLVHEVVPSEALASTTREIVDHLLAGAPEAQQICKALVRTIADGGHTPAEVDAYTANLIAKVRAAREAQEGMAAFLAKRSPQWHTTWLPSDVPEEG